jgi:hypothetical protein
MSSVIQNMIQQTIGDGARSSKFDCIISIADLSNTKIADENIVFHVKTSQFPGKTNEVIDFKFKGRTIPLKGQVKYDNTWTCTFYLTEKHNLRTKFLNWIEALDGVNNMENNLSAEVKNLQADFAKKDSSYTREMKITQKNFNGDTDVVEYTLHNVFPKSVSAVDVDYSAVGTILEYTVEFSYSHFTVKLAPGSETESKTIADGIRENVTNQIDKVVEKTKDDLKNATSKYLFSEGGFSKTVSNVVNDIRDDFGI